MILSTYLQGAQQISPFPSVEDLIGRLLSLLCDQNDPERAFVKFNKNDDVVLFISNLGGLSVLELGALTQEILAQLGNTLVKVCRNITDHNQIPTGTSNPQTFTQERLRHH